MNEATLVQVPERRTRINFGMNAKGLVRMDTTCEYETPEESAQNAEKAIELYTEVCHKKGLKLASEVE